MAEKILAIFETADDASRAVETLRREGVSRDRITIMSSEPVHIAADEDHNKKSRIALFAIAGAVIGGLGAYLLTALTSRSVNLVTGGMPIVSPWPFGIIIYEMTALGAILGSLGRMIYEARLARPGALSDYDEAVADGRIVLLVACDDEARATAIKKALADEATLRD
jgi:hypothetical protein